MIWLLITIALVSGMLLPVQAGINSQLRTHIGHPIVAAAINFLLGTAALIAVSVAMRAPLPDFSKLSTIPWWLWLGGIYGANYIVISILLAPRLGAATLIGASVTGQMLISLALDHFGFVGYPVHPVNAWRVVGAGFLLTGLLMIQRF
jgi:bacterial/archaeal transporter family-2 protein